MPIYCYTCDGCGETHDEMKSTSTGIEPWILCPLCSGHANRDYQAEVGVCKRAEAVDLRSVAAGVQPAQAREANRQAAALGLADAVRFDSRTGDAIFANRQAKLRAIKHMGLHDKDEIRG